MLKDDFYFITTLNTEGSCIKAVLELNPDHSIFNGHFPGTPVVPGVCMMQMVKEIVETVNDKSLLLSKADFMKFLSVIDPLVNSVVMIDISCQVVDDAIDVTANLYAEERICFKFKGRFVVSL